MKIGGLTPLRLRQRLRMVPGNERAPSLGGWLLAALWLVWATTLVWLLSLHPSSTWLVLHGVVFVALLRVHDGGLRD